jgi:hypothetical protein
VKCLINFGTLHHKQILPANLKQPYLGEPPEPSALSEPQPESHQVTALAPNK